MNGKTIWREVRFLGMILFGSVCYAIGFDLFLMLHQVNAGGVSGASMLICAALGWDGGVGILTLGINVPLFLLGYRYLGKRFFAGSIVGTIATSAFIELFARIPAPQTDIMLGVLYGGVLVGLGLGVVFYAGASTGGVDIIASLLRKKFRSISVGNLMLAVDSAVIILTGVVYRDITGGVGNGLFAPDGDCTRAQIVAFLWRAAGRPEPESKANFVDVPAKAYYAKAVAWALENGITKGTSATTFSPDDPCTRAQAVTFLARALSAKAEGTADFLDVAETAYYAKAVAWASENGVTSGVGGTRFAPGQTCTRAQIVTFLYRAYNK